MRRTQVVSPTLNERTEPKMRIQVTFPALLFVFLLFIAGCGGEETSTPEEGGTTTTAPARTTTEATQNTTVASAPDESTTIAIIGANGERTEVEVEIADDTAEQRRGLMERTELAENAGMLFVFDREEPRSFWMRNTLIPLSIAYIASDGRIVDIQDMQPLDETSHPSAEPAQYALEVNQGFFAERGIEAGNVVEVPDLRGSNG
ncbi:MAG: DUF192 domain-containing protein [Actinomycetota bacterium]|nr:DUF192 domain-containing protein [Actinomycetota bacterium]